VELKLSERSILVLAVIVAESIALAGINPYLSGGGDNAGYIAEAESLLKTGQRTSLHLAGDPPAAFKPPLFPIMLAGVESLFGRNLTAMRVMLAGFAVLSVLAAWFAIKTALGGSTRPDPEAGRTASFVALWFALTTALAQVSHDILADVPFTFATLLAIGLAGRCARGTTPRRDVPALAFTLVVATMLRTAGLIIAGGCTAFLCLEVLAARKTPDFKPMLVRALAIAAITIALLLSIRGSGTSYFSYFTAKDQPQVAAVAAGESALIRVTRWYALFLPAEIAGYKGLGPATAVYALGALAAVLTLLGAGLMLRDGQRLVPVCFAVYQSVLLAWPFMDTRYYLPTLPLYLCMILVGARWLIRKASILGRAPAAGLVCILAVLPCVSIFGVLLTVGSDKVESTTIVEWAAGLVLAVLITGSAARAATGTPLPFLYLLCGVVLALAATRTVCQHVLPERTRGPAPRGTGWQEFYDACLWLKDNASEKDAVISGRTALVWFWSGRKGVEIARDGGNALRADWAIVDGIGEDEMSIKYVLPRILAEKERWELRWRRNQTLVFQQKRVSSSP
jgi:hypothetical protein